MDEHFYRKKTAGGSVGARLRKLLKNRRAVLGIIIGVPVVLTVLFGSHGIVQRIRLERQKTEMEERVRQAEEETKRLQQESRALDADKKTIEKTAREKYGMAKEGEQVYKTGKKP